METGQAVLFGLALLVFFIVSLLQLWNIFKNRNKD